MSRRRSSSRNTLQLESDKQIPVLDKLIRRGPLTLVFVYSPTCPHCHTYQPIWDELCETKGRKTNMVRMRSDTYQKTPLAAQKTIEGVPSVLYVDQSGRVTEEQEPRNLSAMKNVVKTASPASAPTPAPTPSSVVDLPEIADFPIPGTEMQPNPLEPIPGTTVTPPQMGGNPWAAFLMSAARQAGPAAALLGAYAALPKRSSGLPRATRRRRHRKSSLRNRRSSLRNHRY